MNLDSLTMRDVATIESLSGLSISELDNEETPKGKLFAAMVFVIKKKDDKKFTFDDALDMPMSELTTLLGGADDTDSKSAE